MLQQVAEGAYFLQLQSTFERLDRTRRKQGERFWKQPDAVQQYAQCQEHLGRCRDLFDEARWLETEGLLTVLNQQPADVGTWQEWYQELLEKTDATLLLGGGALDV